jgi:ElaB/YqjD/DUF883 family membrane-anchored ribosome-binding protein
MASDDAEMPSRYKLGDDLNQINQDLASLRRNLEGLAGDVASTGSHQIDNLQSIAKAAIEEVEASVQRNPLSAIALAAGIGFLYGILTRR